MVVFVSSWWLLPSHSVDEDVRRSFLTPLAFVSSTLVVLCATATVSAQEHHHLS